MRSARSSSRGPVRPHLVLAICCMSLLIVGLDNTIVNVALPALGRDLHTGVSGLQWTVAGYTLVLASLLMLSGSMADRLGRRRVFQLGLAIFTLGSLLCSLASNLGELVAFRMIQGIGGSMLNPVAMSIIRNTFEDPRERARAIGVWGATIGVSLALGPVVGGILVGSVSWRAIFWINIPIGLAALILTALFVPESRAPRARRPDPLGQVLVIALIGALTYGIIEGPERGWLADGRILAAFAIALASLCALLAWERRRIEPLVELRFFKSLPFSGASAIAVIAFSAFGGFLFLNTLYLQGYRHLSAFHAGLYTLPIAAMAIIFAPLSGRVVGRLGSRPPLILAGLTLAAGAGLLVGLSPSTSMGWMILAYVVFGFGFGILNPPITTTAVGGMPAAQAGVAAAVASSCRQVGQTLGVAVVGAVAIAGASFTGGSLGARFPESSHTGWWFCVGCGLAVAALGFLSTTRRAIESARRAASELSEETALIGAREPGGRGAPA